MTEYRIAEEHNRFRIQYSNGMVWHDLNQLHVPRFFDTLQDARSWVATIKRGVVYHSAEDAPNLAQDERRAESGVKVCDEWEEHITRHISWLLMGRGTVNGVEIRRISIDDNVIRIYT
jgi:hypothetical protein